jgi:hypothetical protein
LHDLRKATALSIPSATRCDVVASVRNSEDSQPPVRKQQSRKDLARQAKLLKKVSNLEDKLERARRELRELAGGEEPAVLTRGPDTLLHGRPFVPRALPSLPSERLLNGRPLGSASEVESDPDLSSSCWNSPSLTGERRKEVDDEGLASAAAAAPVPKPRQLSRELKVSATRDIPSHGRKGSPDLVGPGAKDQKPRNLDSRDDYSDLDVTDAETAPTHSFRKRQPPRHAKLQKGARGDSAPAAVASTARRDVDPIEPIGNRPKTVRPVEAPRSLLPAPTRPARSKAKSTPCLKVKRSVPNLRAVGAGDGDLEGLTMRRGRPRLHLQDHQHPSGLNVAVPPGVEKRGRRCDEDENVPPVPPVPRDLISNAAQAATDDVNSGGKARPVANSGLEKIQESGDEDGDGRAQTSAPNAQAVPDRFEWPEDIF